MAAWSIQKQRSSERRLSGGLIREVGVDYKPGSVTDFSACGHFSGTRVTPGLVRPTWVEGWAIPAAVSYGPLFGLASGGVCKAIQSPECWWALTPPFHPYPASRPGGVFSVALSLGFPPVPVRDHPALRCPDFPQGLGPRGHTSTPHLLDLFLKTLAIVYAKIGKISRAVNEQTRGRDAGAGVLSWGMNRRQSVRVCSAPCLASRSAILFFSRGMC